ncbi:hypothetical protein L6452_43380 [Arctium lappa]|uniref:Uncharacterized protein n=1 Tax=Arctium lappa TaxID=4217 RepID=A0ACB8XKV7_ARCLA|nr:hypothetical protein L6452_43380 [Arctium lappa]
MARVKGDVLLASYWRRRGYKRLGTSSSSQGSKRGRRWSWRIRITPKLKLRYFNPNKFLIGLHDAYVRMMMRLANSRVVAISTGYGLNAMSPFGMTLTKEYDDKMIIQMYMKSLVVGQTPQQIIS